MGTCSPISARLVPMSELPQRMWLSRNVRGSPGSIDSIQRPYFADLDRQRIHVDAVDAPPDDVAECALIVVRCGRASHPDARDAVGEPPRCREQEVPRAAGGVDDGQLQKCFDGVFGMRVDRAFDHRVEGAREEKLHQLVGCVVAACRLPRMASALVRRLRRQKERPSSDDLRDQLQEALVDVA